MAIFAPSWRRLAFRQERSTHVRKSFAIFSGKANPELARAVCGYLGQELGSATVERFADGESYVEINQNVRGVVCFVVQPTCTPVNDNLMELLVMIDALKRSSAKPIVAVMPYFGYARQDRKTRPRTPISARLVADLLTAAGVHRILAMDLHAGQIQGFFNIPVDHIYAMPVMMEYLRTKFDANAVIVSPDAGGVERARAYSKRLGASLAIIDKRRPSPNVAELVNIIGDVKDRDAIIIDDMVDTAGTLCAAADGLTRNGARAVYACITHGLLSGHAVTRIANSTIKELIITDSIPLRPDVKASPKVRALSVARLLSEAVKRIHEGDSLSSLFI
ncbi:MAG: ribose-phosphate pyrophosphokinase [Deltaproteobacteria bacterium]|jgi:ribose-phosphate pyrophosphokinase|nr:ribose-phosphate pyrophosphokinase [Deltaproteobacteria bacterium]